MVLIDLTIGLYVASLAAVLLLGGVRLGGLRATEASKPLLVLLILGPVRVALARAGLSGPLDPAWRAIAAACARFVGRVPPWVRDVLVIFVVTRITVLAVAFGTNVLVPPHQPRPFAMPFARARLAELFAAWDSGWYFDIASRGYYYSEHGQSSIAFFPLYPLAMRALAWPFGGSDRAVWAAGIAISLLAALAALLALHRLTVRYFDDSEVARRTVLYASIFPFSFFLSRVYPSALFLLLSILAVGAAHRSRWWLAGLWGGFATLTRPHGVLIGIPIALMALRGAHPRELMTRGVALAPIPLALVGYSLYVALLSGGNPLAWLGSQNQWGYSLGHPPWQQLLALMQGIERHGLYEYFFTSDLAFFRLVHGVVAVSVLMITPLVFARLGVALGVYVLVSVLIPLSSNALEGIGRYALGYFPCFMVLGSLSRPRVHEAILIVWSALLTLFVGLFVTWYPIY